jgi:chemotaxis protein methyltransferase CheR
MVTTASAETRSQELSRASGLDLEAYRHEHVAERVRRAVEREQLADLDELAGRLSSDRGARTRFRRSVAVSVSGMFREPEQFDLLQHRLLPLLRGTGGLSVWSAGCADGSELYSVALLLERCGRLEGARLLGSDILEENLERARARLGDGVFSASVAARVRFERRDLANDGAPAGRWQLVLCRNVAIYLAPAAKRRLHERLAGALAGGGVLLLGRSERLADAGSLGLEPLAPHAYRRAA